MYKSFVQLVLSLLFLLLTTLTFAQDIRKVGGDFLYYADPDMPPKAAKAAAIENAKIQALALEFGTLISQQTDQRDVSINGAENSFFMQLNQSEVKGEWLEDLKDPECVFVEMLPDGMCVYRATVQGRARAISNESVDFEAYCLKNGTSIKFADTMFREGDDLFVSFKAPLDGYVCVYLVDQTPEAYCLLPYSGDEDGQYRVKRNKDYVFFSEDNCEKSELGIVDEMVITCSNEYEERNQLYIIYSPNPFSKALDSQQIEGLPRQLSYSSFQNWLSRCRRRDPKMGMKVFHLIIHKQ